MRIGSAVLPLLLAILTLPAGPPQAGAAEEIALLLDAVELADEPRELQRGLMERQDLCDRCAMLFVWPDEGLRSFWMKNTPLSLDMIFMNSKGRIVTIHEETVPFRTNPSYHSTQRARFVLEAKAGFVARQSLKEGDVVDLDELFSKAEAYRWSED